MPDLKDHRYVPRIRDLVSSARSGLTGTPTWFDNGVRHDGGYDEASLMQAFLVARVEAARASHAM
jgi:hypothetical protein